MAKKTLNNSGEKSDFAKRLEIIVREIFNNNQTYFAKVMGVSRQNVNQWLNGESEPRRIYLEKLVKLGVNPNWLHYGVGSIYTDEENGRDLEKYFVYQNKSFLKPEYVKDIVGANVYNGNFFNQIIEKRLQGEVQQRGGGNSLNYNRL